MSYIFKEREAPKEWREFRKDAPHAVFTPFFALSWMADWAAWFLCRWPVVELLEYLGSFSILFAAIFYFMGAPDRLKQKHYQAWQVINTAQGKGGSGGRLDALQDLNHDHVSIIGVNVSNSYLQGILLPGARARRADFSDCDLRDADFDHAVLADAELHYANFRSANLRDCDLSGANLNDADFAGAELSHADLSGATLDRADLRNSDLNDIRDWQSIKSINHANIFGVTNAPAGFKQWALQKGAVEVKSD